MMYTNDPDDDFENLVSHFETVIDRFRSFNVIGLTRRDLANWLASQDIRLGYMEGLLVAALIQESYLKGRKAG